ncbi:MAG: hypothetical protein QOD50_309 [Actinomycetota bacterium]|jgi:hypothetical protein|nr:hypothetical protein [Actinomycetota bacterium]
MAWWNDIVTWFNSAAGSRVFLSAILPFIAIVLAGIIAAAIGRGSAQRVLAHEDRELTGAALIALIVVGRKASIWASLGSDEKQHIDSLMSEADIRVRLLPVTGSSQAADWAAHELSDMKKNSASFSFQAEQDFVDYRDRLLDWQAKPRRARKLFASDLEQWRYEDSSPANAAPQEWTPAGATSDATAVLPATPGLSTAPPPTTTAVSAPAPTSARAHANAAESPANGVTA